MTTPRTTDRFSSMKGSSHGIAKVRDCVVRFALQDTPALIVGETGTGKELVARAIHEQSERRHHPFFAFNCGAATRSLFESQMFGHARGAFTGAYTAHSGLATEVGKGVLFLDEIGDLPLDVQATLLRFLEGRTFLPVGKTREEPFHGRIVCATHVDLEQRVAEGRFRHDLYRRLKVLKVVVPPLRDRRGDIDAICDQWIQQKGTPITLTSGARAWLQARPWEGNVRQLLNLLEFAMTMALDPSAPSNPLIITASLLDEVDSPDPSVEEADQVPASRASILPPADDLPSSSRPGQSRIRAASKSGEFVLDLDAHDTPPSPSARPVQPPPPSSKAASSSGWDEMLDEVNSECPSASMMVGVILQRLSTEEGRARIDQLERLALRYALRCADGNQTKAGDFLGKSRATIARWLREHEERESSSTRETCEDETPPRLLDSA